MSPSCSMQISVKITDMNLEQKHSQNKKHVRVKRKGKLKTGNERTIPENLKLGHKKIAIGTHSNNSYSIIHLQLPALHANRQQVLNEPGNGSALREGGGGGFWVPGRKLI